ncbi:hypothetical protein NFI96_019632 [Prochilodus magdalenae]|nr:hypothetical protein NFI96_019632 [Prochilodus magdalenae]
MDRRGLVCFTLVLLAVQLGAPFNLDVEKPSVFSGPQGSYFGFSVDFFNPADKQLNILVGAPKANTSSSSSTVLERGAVYSCPWQTGGSCAQILFDDTGPCWVLWRDRVGCCGGTVLGVVAGPCWVLWQDRVGCCGRTVLGVVPGLCWPLCRACAGRCAGPVLAVVPGLCWPLCRACAGRCAGPVLAVVPGLCWPLCRAYVGTDVESDDLRVGAVCATERPLAFAWPDFLKLSNTLVPFYIRDLDKDDRSENGMQMEFKSNQWFGATVRSDGEHILACAPLYQWSTYGLKEREPVGTCFLKKGSTVVEYSPCRSGLATPEGQGFCQAGFSADIIKVGALSSVGGGARVGGKRGGKQQNKKKKLKRISSSLEDLEAFTGKNDGDGGGDDDGGDGGDDDGDHGDSDDGDSDDDGDHGDVGDDDGDSDDDGDHGDGGDDGDDGGDADDDGGVIMVMMVMVVVVMMMMVVVMMMMVVVVVMMMMMVVVVVVVVVVVMMVMVVVVMMVVDDMLPALRAPHELVVVQSGQLISDDISEVISRISQKFVTPYSNQMTTKSASAQYDDSYLGYSVAVGDFNQDGVDDYATGVPRGEKALGYVNIFNGRNMESMVNFTGQQMAAYFGNAVAATDVNKDGSQGPRSQGPRSQSPRSQSPRSQSPRSQSPRSQSPRSQSPRSQSPRSQSPMCQSPMCQSPMCQSPMCQSPMCQSPMCQSPMCQSPMCQSPRCQSPRCQSPRSQSPRSQSPRSQSPRSQSPRIVDLLVGAPLFMERGSDGKLREVGQVYVYLGKGGFSFSPPSKLTGSEIYARYGSAISVLGDLDMDGFNDVAIAAPYGGPSRQGLVYIHNGRPSGPDPQPSQVLEGKWASTSMPPSFGYSMHGATDIDQNGYPDLVVGVFGADKAVLYRARPVISVNATLDISPQILSPEEKKCQLPGTSTMVSCFMVKYCLKASGKGAPSTLKFQVDLTLDRLKQKGAIKRVLFLHNRMAQYSKFTTVSNAQRPSCEELQAYLIDDSEFRDKITPISVFMEYSLDYDSAADKTGLRPILDQSTPANLTKQHRLCEQERVNTGVILCQPHSE